VSKRELKPVLLAKGQETGDMANIERLIKLVEAMPKSLVEKYDFRDVLLKWDKENIDAKTAANEAKVEAEMKSSNKNRPRY
jgi:hypothetical protein